MFNKYLLNLYKQYCDARGKMFDYLDVINSSNDFVEWITMNKVMLKKYYDYLQSLGYCNSSSMAEVGKGIYDSIADDQMAVISLYADTLQLVNSELFVIGGVPFVEEAGKIILPQQHILLTHNPYDEMRIREWSSIHNVGQYDISIGIFGSVYDDDFAKKVDLIEEISKQMKDDYTLDYDTDNDKYFCSLNSRRLVRERILTK